MGSEMCIRDSHITAYLLEQAGYDGSTGIPLLSSSSMSSVPNEMQSSSSIALPENAVAISEIQISPIMNQALSDPIVDEKRSVIYIPSGGISFDAIDIHSGERVWGWATRGNIRYMAISPDNNYLYVAYSTGNERIYIFNIEQQELVETLSLNEIGVDETIFDLAVNEDFIIVSVDSLTPRLIIYDRETLAEVDQRSVIAPTKIELSLIHI